MRPEKRIGRVVADRYQLERLLGRGGMGVVYAGTHTWTERPVAVKVLQPPFADDARTLKRFFQEAKAAASLRHPHVVDVLDMGEDDDGSAFIVLELLEGESLEERLERDGKLSLEDASAILLPVMDALVAAHEKGVVHRDLKPANVFLATGHKGELVPKLLDFGIAKLLEGSDVKTRTGSMLGTPAYMSPEQIRANSEVGPPSDVYGMGVLWFRALSGSLPLTPHNNPTMMLMEAISKPRPPLRSVADHISEEVCAVVDQALERDLAQRHPTMAAFVEALEAAT